ncbi:M48 family metallopeptidase [Hyalangium rubrum]|uniref:M48 family metallopeptidase n=1 Tax=Hyalangium rubrum TaxID=3103134 RepID=A0ABU5HFZ2_9BACT|nr:M48 family metallopeptidase [Hyalangium sp. s54d21]MDY7231733.1 M48 family metallopeptidase [Hyalangium sp. s54d21]
MRRMMRWAGGLAVLCGLLAVPALADTRGFDPVAATDAYLASVPPEAKARSDAYFEGGYWLLLWEPLYGLAVAWVLMRFGLSSRMRNLGQRFGGKGFFGTVLYAIQYLVLAALLSFPLTVYTDFVREHQYDLSNQGFGDWFGQLLIELAVTAVMAGLATGVLYAVIRAAPKRWWVWAAGVGVGFLVVALLLGPVFISPLFNEYKPLEPGPIRDKVLSMARANGVPAEHVYMFDASRQSKRISANVSGIFGTLRISLNDNLLNRSTPEEIQMVMAHELGHYVLNHVYEMLLSFSLVLLVGFAFIAWALPRVLARWGKRWGVEEVGDPAGLPVLMALLSLYFLVATPVTNTVVRANEAEADLFGLNASGQPDGFATVALKLGEYRKLAPGPLEEFLLFDHPSGRSRILMGMRWKAEHQAP